MSFQKRIPVKLNCILNTCMEKQIYPRMKKVFNDRLLHEKLLGKWSDVRHIISTKTDKEERKLEKEIMNT